MADFYYPAIKGGGVARTIGNMVEHFGDRFHFRIITRDRDFRATEPLANLLAEQWTRVGKAEVRYLPPQELGFSGLRQVVNDTPHDVLYLCSFFSPRMATIPLLLRRFGLIHARSVVLAPHGELSPGALESKWLKKRLHLLLARALRLCDGVSWRASTAIEESQLRSLLGSHLLVHVARDLPTVDAEAELPSKVRTKTRGSLSAVFLSRISPKKNLDWILGLLGDLQGVVSFHIYGFLDDEGYWRDCQRLARALPPNVTVHEHGIVAPERVLSVLRRHHLFVLPSRDENFGHVVVEALTAGCMVLLSDQTPWRDLSAKGIGWDLPLSRPEAFREALQRCIDMDDGEFRLMSERAREHAASIVADRTAIDQNRAVLDLAVSKAGCV